MNAILGDSIITERARLWIHELRFLDAHYHHHFQICLSRIECRQQRRRRDFRFICLIAALSCQMGHHPGAHRMCIAHCRQFITAYFHLFSRRRCHAFTSLSAYQYRSHRYRHPHRLICIPAIPEPGGGRHFWSIMTVWFIMIGVIGVVQLTNIRRSLHRWIPRWAINLLANYRADSGCWEVYFFAPQEPRRCIPIWGIAGKWMCAWAGRLCW